MYREDSETFHVRSFTNPEIEYMVYHSTKEGWVCDCKGFMFGRKCKHIEYVLKEYGLER